MTSMRLPVTLCLAVCSLVLLEGCVRQRPWNVLLVTLDTTRADRLGCYGKAAAGTPHLDRLAVEGVRFERATATNPVTQASHTSLLTGTWPMTHGVRDNLFFRIRPGLETLATLLRDRGYATGAAIGGFPLTREFGLDVGFDFYDDDLAALREDHRGVPVMRSETWYEERPADRVNDAMIPWLRERLGRPKPFFAWVHYWDPHRPYIAPDPYRQLYADDPYQAEVAFVDACLGGLLEMLEDAGELERTLIIVTADHGEGLMQHREMTHAFLAYETTLRVPLIMWKSRKPSSNHNRKWRLEWS